MPTHEATQNFGFLHFINVGSSTFLCISITFLALLIRLGFIFLFFFGPCNIELVHLGQLVHLDGHLLLCLLLLTLERLFHCLYFSLAEPVLTLLFILNFFLDTARFSLHLHDSVALTPAHLAILVKVTTTSASS